MERRRWRQRQRQRRRRVCRVKIFSRGGVDDLRVKGKRQKVVAEEVKKVNEERKNTVNK